MGLLDLLKKSDEEIKNETLSKYNIFEGINCEVILPEKQLKTFGSSAMTKALATFALGIVGWAATSGYRTNEENRIISTIFQVVDKGIVFKNGATEGNDLRIPYNLIVKMFIIDNSEEIIGAIVLLENKRIYIDPKVKGNSEIFKINQIRIILKHISSIINERATGAQYEEAGWGREHATAEPQETKQEGSSLMDELERLGNMYKEGLLTDEEFAAMKKKLIEE